MRSVDNLKFVREEEIINPDPNKTWLTVNGKPIITAKQLEDKAEQIQAVCLLDMPDIRRPQLAKNIAIGGMIAMGKSTLVEALHKEFADTNVVYELEENNTLMNELLKLMYERENKGLYGPGFQMFFLLQRFQRYCENANKEQVTIFDRTIFEDWLFARENIEDPSVMNYYNALWDKHCKEIMYSVGVPSCYIILSGSWELFKERLFKRDRKSETDNYDLNEEYYKGLHAKYVDYLVNICKGYGIPYLVVNADMTTEEQVNFIKENLSLGGSHD